MKSGENLKRVVIIGAGAAGLLCGAKCALRGFDVTVIEKMPRPARKLMITGKGRCNVTNACDNETLLSNIILYKPLNRMINLVMCFIIT